MLRANRPPSPAARRDRAAGRRRRTVRTRPAPRATSPKRSRGTAISRSACGRLWSPRKRSMAQPAATYQGARTRARRRATSSGRQASQAATSGSNDSGSGANALAATSCPSSISAIRWHGARHPAATLNVRRGRWGWRAPRARRCHGSPRAFPRRPLIRSHSGGIVPPVSRASRLLVSRRTRRSGGSARTPTVRGQTSISVRAILPASLGIARHRAGSPASRLTASATGSIKGVSLAVGGPDFGGRKLGRQGVPRARR